jgi:formate dehydrogenase subunit gamma
VLFLALATVSATAQQAEHPDAGSVPVNPTAQAVTEEQLLESLRRIEGRVTIPSPPAAILEQPQGREYQAFHERFLPWLGGVAILGMLLALIGFYLLRGPVKLHRPLSGTTINRFTAAERFTHWLTAVSFIVLALTGLNYVFGKRLLMPLLGFDTFAAWSQWAKYAHNAFAWPFILGLVLMIVWWVRDNLPDRHDIVWLRNLGGFFTDRHLPARRFNAGQKLIFWCVAAGGLALTVSGLVMLVALPTFSVTTLQAAQYIHAIVGVILIAVILAHIYIGTIGMQGASDAMVSGEVDLAWAREHHSLWVEEEQKASAQLGKGTIPAE